MHTSRVLVFSGIASFALYAGMTRLSFQFNWGEGYADRPILTYLILYAALFAIYVLACSTVLRRQEEARTFWWILGFGLLFRAVLLPANQIQEDDVYRYLWDGKVFAHGINPYEYAPAETDGYLDFKITDPEGFLQRYDTRQQKQLEQLNQLKWKNQSSLKTLERVNHPDVPTIYPPAAQYVFRLAHFFKPDSILSMRGIFLILDLFALLFIVRILESAGKPHQWALIYYWSPLLIKETFNSTHLDIIGIALLCAAVYFLLAHRFFLSMIFLSLSFLAKFYPAILLPVFLQQAYLENKRRKKPATLPLLAGTALFAGVALLFYIPFLGTGLETFEGLKTYSTYWQSNDSIFALLLFFFKDVLRLDSGDGFLFAPNLAVFLSKAVVSLIFLTGLVLVLLRGRDPAPGHLLAKVFLLMALVFLLSPVQNPWYLLWVLPFICIFPWPSWIALTGLIGLYYLDFYFDYQEMQAHAHWIPWMEYAPFYLLLAVDLWKRWILPTRSPAS